jgi:hypothetical protein
MKIIGLYSRVLNLAGESLDRSQSPRYVALRPTAAMAVHARARVFDNVYRAYVALDQANPNPELCFQQRSSHLAHREQIRW